MKKMAASDIDISADLLKKATSMLDAQDEAIDDKDGLLDQDDDVTKASTTITFSNEPKPQSFEKEA